MGPLIPILVLLLLAPAVVVVFVAWRWLVRSGHTSALAPFLGSAISGGIALLAFLVAIGCFMNLAMHVDNRTGRGGGRAAGILLVVSVLVFGVASLISIALGLWTILRVNRAPQVAQTAP